MEMVINQPENDAERQEALDHIQIERLKPHDSRADIARGIEYQVFSEAGFSEGTEGYVNEYEAYEPNSIFYLATSVGEPAGMLRVILATDERVRLPDGRLSTGFKTLDDFALFPPAQYEFAQRLLHEPRLIGEVGTAAVLEKWRQTPVADQLYRRAIEDGVANGQRYCIASIDADLLAAYREHRMFPFRDIGATDLEYMGSPTTPVIMDVYTLPDYWARENPAFYRKMLGEEPKAA